MPLLDKCYQYKKSFGKGQEYWELKRKRVVIMNSCLSFWDKNQGKYSHELCQEAMEVKLKL